MDSGEIGHSTLCAISLPVLADVPTIICTGLPVSYKGKIASFLVLLHELCTGSLTAGDQLASSDAKRLESSKRSAIVD